MSENANLISSFFSGKENLREACDIIASSKGTPIITDTP